MAREVIETATGYKSIVRELCSNDESRLLNVRPTISFTPDFSPATRARMGGNRFNGLRSGERPTGKAVLSPLRQSAARRSHNQIPGLNAEDAKVTAKAAKPFRSAFLCENLCVLCVKRPSRGARRFGDCTAGSAVDGVLEPSSQRLQPGINERGAA